MPRVFRTACRAETIPTAPLADNHYERCVHALIRGLDLADCKDVSVFSRSNGLFPTELIKQLGNYCSSSILRYTYASGSLEYENWPEEHPLDFDWRFCRNTARSIAEFAKQFDKVLCIGTPTVYWYLRDANRDDWLVDRNPCLKEIFSSCKHILICDVEDLNENHMGSEFDAVIFDPPWYLGHFMLWIEVAARHVKQGGSLVLTRFPPLIRPTAREERRRIESRLLAIGPVKNLDVNVTYRTPTFEQATLHLNGFGEIPYWRSAQLVSVEVAAPVPKHRCPKTHRDRWFRFRLGSQVIAVRDTDPLEREAGVATAPVALSGQGLVLETVSGRYEGRDRIDLWTSRNLALQVRGRSTMITFLKMLEAGRMPEQAAADVAESIPDRLALLSLACYLGCEMV